MVSTFIGGEIGRGIVTICVVAHTGIAPYGPGADAARLVDVAPCGALRIRAIAVLGLTPPG
jgi:hypothetical protein